MAQCTISSNLAETFNKFYRGAFQFPRYLDNTTGYPDATFKKPHPLVFIFLVAFFVFQNATV